MATIKLQDRPRVWAEVNGRLVLFALARRWHHVNTGGLILGREFFHGRADHWFRVESVREQGSPAGPYRVHVLAGHEGPQDARILHR